MPEKKPQRNQQSVSITEIYEYYQIMPNLQHHQLRVAAVATWIVHHLNLNTSKMPSKDHIITATLLHDMGNILKSDLRTFPEFIPTDQVTQWQNIKDSFRNSYGDDEHAATIQIAKELGLNQETITLIDCIGFTKAIKKCQNIQPITENRSLR